MPDGFPVDQNTVAHGVLYERIVIPHTRSLWDVSGGNSGHDGILAMRVDIVHIVGVCGNP